MGLQKKHCESCEHWSRDTVEEFMDVGHAECTEDSPKYIDEKGIGRWPLTSFDNKCGKWAPLQQGDTAREVILNLIPSLPELITIHDVFERNKIAKTTIAAAMNRLVKEGILEIHSRGRGRRLTVFKIIRSQ